MSFLDELLEQLWADHAALTPQVTRLHQLLRDRGETVRNDHIALRTFDLPEVDIDALDRAFVAEGYEPAQSYQFPDKKLIAYHYEHRDGHHRPKLFISALLVDDLSREAQEIVRGLAAEVEPGAAAHPYFAASGRHWEVSRSTYERLRRESEYGAWVAAFGFRANHFTVNVGSLRSFAGLAELNRFLEESGFRLNRAGGEIKGSPAELLEQSSTMADEVEVQLSDGAHRIPGCYCEFARRYPQADGALFQGFVPGSTDRLFESTDRASPQG